MHYAKLVRIAKNLFIINVLLTIFHKNNGIFHIHLRVHFVHIRQIFESCFANYFALVSKAKFHFIKRNVAYCTRNFCVCRPEVIIFAQGRGKKCQILRMYASFFEVCLQIHTIIKISKIFHRIVIHHQTIRDKGIANFHSHIKKFHCIFRCSKKHIRFFYIQPRSIIKGFQITDFELNSVTNKQKIINSAVKFI